MYISRIELTNIKSHARSVFEFGPGTTAITGENGAGKTTIIEAIAWVLFDLLDYKKDQFVRRGQTKGSAAVSFVSSLDERTYTVFRDTGTGYYVTDPRINTRIADKKDEVQRFLWQHLVLEPGTDLESLFRHAVGVPQGTLTSIFLATATTKKGVFDRLLKVEEYREASDKLRETVKHVELRIADARESIARAEGLLARGPQLEEEHESQIAAVQKIEADAVTLESELATARERVATLDAHEALFRDYQVTENERKRLTEELTAIEAAKSELEALRPKADEQQALEARAAELRERLAAVRVTVAEVRRLEDTIRQKRERYKKNAEEIKAAATRAEAAAAMGSLEESQTQLTGEIARLRAELERDERFQKEVRNGLCPILTQRCLNLSEGQTLDQFMQDQFPKRREELERREAEARALAEQLQAARAAQNVAATLAKMKEQNDQLAEEGKRLAEDLKAIGDIPDPAAIEADIAAVEASLKRLDDPRRRAAALEATVGREREISEKLAASGQRIAELRSKKSEVDARLASAGLDPSSGYDASRHRTEKGQLVELERRHAAHDATLAAARKRIADIERELASFVNVRRELSGELREKDQLQKVLETTAFIRDTLKEAAPRVARNYVHHVSLEANLLFREITGNGERSLKWNEDYSVTMEEEGFERPFVALSGGEQMSAALAVRLALLKQLSGIRLAFFDEPTANMDATRRENLAIEISRIKHFDQLFVISHDDTFDNYVDHVVAVG